MKDCIICDNSAKMKYVIMLHVSLLSCWMFCLGSRLSYAQVQAIWFLLLNFFYLPPSLNNLWMCVACCKICSIKFISTLINIIIYNKYFYLLVLIPLMWGKTTIMTFLRKHIFIVWGQMKTFCLFSVEEKDSKTCLISITSFWSFTRKLNFVILPPVR